MTKWPGRGTPRALTAALPLALLLASLPTAWAHGAPATRELDTRVLLDDDGGIGYGGCIEVCNPAAPPEGLDLLALDVREAWLGDEPALVLRILFQSEAVHDGRGLQVEFDANGTHHTLAIADADGANATSPDVDRIDGPVDVGDGHPKALDAWLRSSALGVSLGDALTQMTLQSTHHGEPDDLMPGTWLSQGVEVPHVPHDPADPVEALQPAGPGTYTLKGPAPLLRLDPPTRLLDLATGGELNLTLANPLTALAQFANVTLQTPTGLRATLTGADAQGALQLNLDPATSRRLNVHVEPGFVGGSLRVVATSDLGGRAEGTFEVVPLPAPAAANATAPESGGRPGETANQTPGAGPLLAGAALLLVAVARRGKASPDDGEAP